MPRSKITLPLDGFDDRDATQIPDTRASEVRNVRTTREEYIHSPGARLLAPIPVPAGDPGNIVRVGMFLKPETTGLQVITHDLGATPKALLLFASQRRTASQEGDNASDFLYHTTAQPGYFTAIGMTDGTTTRCVSTASADAVDPTECASQISNRIMRLISPDAGNSTPLSSANFNSWTSTTFTLNWTTNDGEPWPISYIILGATGVSAKVLEWALTAGTGTQAVTGMGFEPQVVLHLASTPFTMTKEVSLAEATLSLGAQQDTAHQWVSAYRSLGNVPSRADQLHYTIGVIAAPGLLTDGDPEIPGAFSEAVSLDPDGFTINKTVAAVTGEPYTVFSLGLTGFDEVLAATFNTPSPAGATPKTVRTLFGFKPNGMLFASANRRPFQLNTVDDDIRQSYGAFDGTTQWGIAFNDDYGTELTDTNSVYLPQEAFVGLDEGGTVPLQRGRLNAFVDQGMRITWESIEPDFIFNWSFVALYKSTATIDTVGTPRTFFQGDVGTSTSDPVALMLTLNSAWLWNPATSLFDATSEVYALSNSRRFSVCGTQGVIAWSCLPLEQSGGGATIRCYDGSTFDDLISSGTNHGANILLAFNDRILSAWTRRGGVTYNTEVRYSVSGDCRDWSGEGSGSFFAVETSPQALTGGLVLGERAYLTKAREVIELIPTGSAAPVFRQATRVSGMGCIATYSIAAGEVFAFWLGPDDVYQWDGQTLRPIGEQMYHTMQEVLPYGNLFPVQGVVHTADSEYHLIIPPYVFIYDYRRERWFQDDLFNDVESIGIIRVGQPGGSLFPANVNASESVIYGLGSGAVLQADKTRRDFLGGAVDSYFVTREIFAAEVIQVNGATNVIPNLERLNIFYRLDVKTYPGARLELAYTTNRMTSWATERVVANSNGYAVMHDIAPFDKIRFRVRNHSAGQNYEIFGFLTMQWEDGGLNLPVEVDFS